MAGKMRSPKDLEVWKAALRTAHERREACRTKLNALDAERAEYAAEIMQLELLINHLTPFTTEHPMDELDRFLEEFVPDADSGGLADACRKVLSNAKRYMTPVEIRDVLEASKYDLTQHNNPLASIHGILKRFEESGEAWTLPNGNKTSYKLAEGGMLRPRAEYEAQLRAQQAERDAREERQAREAVEEMDRRKRVRDLESESKRKASYQIGPRLQPRTTKGNALREMAEELNKKD